MKYLCTNVVIGRPCKGQPTSMVVMTHNISILVVQKKKKFSQNFEMKKQLSWCVSCTPVIWFNKSYFYLMHDILRQSFSLIESQIIHILLGLEASIHFFPYRINNSCLGLHGTKTKNVHHCLVFFSVSMHKMCFEYLFSKFFCRNLWDYCLCQMRSPLFQMALTSHLPTSSSSI